MFFILLQIIRLINNNIEPIKSLHMKKFLLLVLLMFSTMVFSAPIDYKTALENLNHFLKEKQLEEYAEPELACCKRNSSSRNGATNETPLYYIFNLNDDNGFVIVSGDSTLPSILAHVDKGSYEAESANPAFKWWLNAVENSVASATKAPSRSSALRASENNGTEYPEQVEPLIKTKWNQHSPYNNLAPFDTEHGGKSITGCSPVALAQIFNYYKYPKHGTGKTSHYTLKHGFPIEVNLSDYVFEWDKMLDEYKGNESEENKNAVAELIYAIGASVKSDFCYDASSTYNSDVAKALFNNWGYKGIEYISRNYYTAEEWSNLIKDELSSARPVFVSGQSIESGHAFICDGYESNGLFHINWGWGGANDGYFELSALGQYTMELKIITGISPDITTTKKAEIGFKEFTKPNMMQFSRSGVFLSLENITNMSAINDFNGACGIALVDGENILAYDAMDINLPPTYYYKSYSYSLTVPDNVPDGEYKIIVVMKQENSDTFTPIRGYQENNHLTYLNAKVNGDDVILSFPDGYTDTDGSEPILEITDISNSGNLYAGTNAEVTVVVKNISESTFRGYIRIGNTTEASGINLQPLESVTISKTIDLPETGNNCSVPIYFYNDKIGEQLLGTHEITFKTPTAGTPVIELTAGIIEKVIYSKNDTLKQTVFVKNSGGFFKGRIYMYLKKDDKYKTFNSQVFIDKDECDTVEFSIPLSEMAAGKYKYEAYTYIEDVFTHAKPSSCIYVHEGDEMQLADGCDIISKGGYSIERKDKLYFTTTVINIGKEDYKGALKLSSQLNTSKLELELASGKEAVVTFEIPLEKLSDDGDSFTLYFEKSDQFESILDTHILTDKELHGDVETNRSITLNISDCLYSNPPVKGYAFAYEVIVSNESGINYAGVLKYVTNGTGNITNIYVPANGSTTISLSTDVPADCDELDIKFFDLLGDEERLLGEITIITETPVEEKFNLLYYFSLPEKTRYNNKDTLYAKAEIINTGGIYSNSIYFSIENSETGERKLVNIGDYTLNKNHKTSIDFEYSLRELPAGRYNFYIFHKDNSVMYRSNETVSFYIGVGDDYPVLVNNGNVKASKGNPMNVTFQLTNAGNSDFDGEILVIADNIGKYVHATVKHGETVEINAVLNVGSVAKELTIIYYHNDKQYYIFESKDIEYLKNTGIENIIVESKITGIYNLFGQKLQKIDRPGIYIVNGKKVIIKE